MAHDQIHEQQNAVIKGDGGFVGITESPDTLRRWMISAPELSRIITELDDHDSDLPNNKHHEENVAAQKRFHAHVRQLVDVLDEMGNPFSECSADLLSLDTRVIMSQEVVAAIGKTESVGQSQYKSMVDERIIGNSRHINDPITKNNLPLFSSDLSKTVGKYSKVSSMKSDIQLFSRMYIACQNRDGNLDAFFERENHAWPPSLADNNVLRAGNKSELLKCLENSDEQPLDHPDVKLKIFDGAALVHSLDPKKADKSLKTFDDYSSKVFLPYLVKHLQLADRVDVVWDVYRPDSLKAFTRQCRGTGELLRVSGTTSLPSNWKSFLRVDGNKTGLFTFLAKSIQNFEIPAGKQMITTFHDKLLQNCPSANTDAEYSDLQHCSHEEADTRMILHAAHAFRNGVGDVMIHATDTDVVV
ncbi:MAG: hypothetical protein ABW185_26880, partial [Sedimenticola sp.]